MTRLNHKDEYYKNYYFDKKLCHGIEIVAEYNRISKKQAADLLMREGLSKYMGAKVTEQIEMEHAAHELNQKVKLTRFVMILRRYARARGIDISKFI